MKKTTKIIIVAIVAAIVLLGIGYAAISNITLNIGGTLEADPNQANFVVRFTGTPTVSKASKVTASIESDTSAKIDVVDLETVGESVTATYTVENASEDLSADLAVATTNSNEEYFTIKAELGKTSLVAEETTTVVVTATLTKAPITESVTATVDVELTAMPVEPGKEGTSSGINDSSQSPESTLAKVTNANIGDYIDLGNNIVGGTATTDDWRVFYVDEETDTVYAILSEYLPNATKNAEGVAFATAAGLDTSGTYSMYLEEGTNTELVDALTNTTIWAGLANGISGATVTAAPTGELLMNSYNTKNGTELVYTDQPMLDSATTDIDLYAQSTGDPIFSGYWLANTATNENYVWAMYANGSNICPIGVSVPYGVRPVVALPSTTGAELVDGVWTVSK